MTPSKTPVRVLIRRGPVLVLGPLGSYDIGDRLEVDAEEYIVTSIDHDGAGIARTVMSMRAHCEDTGVTPHEAMKVFENVRTSYPLEMATPTARAGMVAQCERNRREFCE